MIAVEYTREQILRPAAGKAELDFLLVELGLQVTLKRSTDLAWLSAPAETEPGLPG